MTKEKQILRDLLSSTDPNRTLNILTDYRGENRTQFLRSLTETMIDSSLSVLHGEEMSVHEWENSVRRLTEQERDEMSENFVVVSKQGLRSLVSMLVRDSLGLTHNFDSIREIVNQVPESERPEFPDLSESSPQERGFVRRATRDLCSTDCPRFCQGDCPFERVDDCPRYREPLSDEEFDLSI